jgi:MFS family permease
MALARGLHEPILAGYVNRYIESPRRATVLSVQSLAGNVAMAIAWPLSGVGADAFGLRGAFLMYATATLVFGGGALLLWDRAQREGTHLVEERDRVSPGDALVRLDAREYRATASRPGEPEARPGRGGAREAERDRAEALRRTG